MPRTYRSMYAWGASTPRRAITSLTCFHGFLTEWPAAVFTMRGFTFGAMASAHVPPQESRKNFFSRSISARTLRPRQYCSALFCSSNSRMFF